MIPGGGHNVNLGLFLLTMLAFFVLFSVVKWLPDIAAMVNSWQVLRLGEFQQFCWGFLAAGG